MKFTVITPKFDLSGVPLAQIRLANALANNNYAVDIIVGNIHKNFSISNHLDSRVKLINLNVKKTRWMIFRIFFYLLKNRITVIFSAEDHLNALILFLLIITCNKSKISCSSRVTPFDTYSNKIFSKKWILKKIIETVMWRADLLTCVSKDMVKQYKKMFKNSKHICVYNIVVSSKIIDDSYNKIQLVKNKRIKILAVGRLEKWKGFDVLIKAITYVRKLYDIEVLILGDGPEKRYLKEIIDNNDLHNIVKLIGYVENPYPYYRYSEIFVLSSYVEGMPNVLIEAMMLGCTPVSTNCDTGPSEIIDNEINGYLSPVGDEKELSNKIILAIKNRIDQKILNIKTQEFSEKTILDKYFNLLKIENE